MKASRYILLLILTSLYTTAYAECPNCYKDQQPLDPARGYSDGRVRIVIGIAVGNGDEAWASPPGTTIPNQRLAAATSQGMSMWNTATDSGGNRTDYFFDTVSGTQPVTNVDIVIVKRPVLNSSGELNLEGEMETGGGRPFKLFVRADIVDRMNDTNLAAYIAHELAHRIGLVDTACAGTLMQNVPQEQPDGSLTMQQTTISAQDVSRVRVQYNAATRPTCTKLDAKANYLDSGGDVGGSCSDEDSDGITTCAGDCNDNLYDPTNNCGGGPDCYQVALSCSDKGSGFVYEDCNCKWVGGECAGGYNPDCTPVVVDVRGDGFSLTDAAGGVGFDLNGNGVIQGRLSWTSQNSDDAWLALDRNGNGVIDSGQELFGNFTPQPPSEAPNGFLALAEFDRPESGGNADGLIDNRDAVFARLRLWQDANHDGVSEPGELHTLSTLDVVRLHLDHKQSKRTDAHGNRFGYRAKVDDAKGAKVNRWAWDVFLVTGP